MRKLNLIFTLAALGFSTSSLAADEKRPGQAAFEELDSDASGTVSFAEFQQRSSEGLANIDTDQNGVLTLDEFLNARSAQGPGRGNRGGDGAPRGEVDQERRAQMQEMMAQRVSERFEAMDTNGDEMVTIEEFQEANFLEMDRDNDGVLTARELRRGDRGGPGGRRGRGDRGEPGDRSRPGGQRGGQSPQA